MMSDDMALVREYGQSNSDQAFATLVSRHVNLVYSVALRQVSDHHLAEEITQAVFVILARKGKSLSPKTILSGWLCRTARNASADTLKIQRRRQFREQEAHMQSILNEPEPGVWNQIMPLLDEALDCLGEKEHDAVVLRYFDGKELKQVGAAMGTTEDAARMRVNRGVENLRDFFTKKGVTLSATAIAGAVAANSVQAAPAALATSITAAALSGTTITTAAVIAATKAIAMTTLQKTIVASAVAVLVGAGVYEAHQVANAHAEFQTLQQQQTLLAEQMRKERDGVTNRLAELLAENERLKTKATTTELLRLRGEVGRLRNNANNPTDATAKALVAKVGVPSASSVNAHTIDQILMKDPDMVKAILEQRAAMFKGQYDPLVKQLNLTSEQAERFYQVLLGGANSQSASTIPSGGNSAEVSQPDPIQQLKEKESDLQALLGDAGYAAYNDYKQTVTDRVLFSTLENYFTDNPLGDDQRQRLLQVMVAARQSIEASSPLDYSQPNAGLQQQEKINQQVLAQAAAFLSPEQLQTLGSSQSKVLGMQKISMALESVLNSPTNAPAGP